MSKESDKLIISMDRDLVKWIDEKIALKQSSDRSQAIEYAVKALKTSGTVRQFDKEA
jgi:metal-responsive CopG/Arc/MetJ family transcriptional regulator